MLCILFFQLDMSGDQIAANLQAVINEVCKHRPLNLGKWFAGIDFPIALWYFKNVKY